MEEIKERLPFPLLGIDSDNACPPLRFGRPALPLVGSRQGSEFINPHFSRFCEKEKITFTQDKTQL